MALGFPQNSEEFLEWGQQFWTQIQKLKRVTALADSAWYPFDSLSALPTVTEVIAPFFNDIAECMKSARAADLGCGDGDFAMLLAGWGLEVDAIDYAPNNFNGMRGVETLARLLNASVVLHSIDLDSRSELPHESYGFILFLNTLYHLKNPYYILERLAFQTRWCVLSTRIAQVTPRVHVRMDAEPLAYLAAGYEVASDPTNYWFFSAAGLLRILQRTRWAIAGLKRVGCAVDSNPVSPNADERMFVLLKSRVHYPKLQVRPLHGWYRRDPGEDSWQWTGKCFALEVVLPLETAVSEFALSAIIPDAALIDGESVILSCWINRELVGSSTYEAAGPIEFKGRLPVFALHEPILRLDFAVNRSVFAPPDPRELGVCIPLDTSQNNTHGIPFRVS